MTPENQPELKTIMDVPPPSSSPSLSTAPLPTGKPGNNIILYLIGMIGLLSVFSAGFYYLGIQKQNLLPAVNNQPVLPKPSSTIVPTEKVTNSPLFSGKLRRLEQNLNIFLITSSDKLNGTENDVVYYEAGKFIRGELKDYFRVIGIKPAGPGEPQIYVLATKDYQTYILDDPNEDTVKHTDDSDWQNPYLYLDKSKIISAQKFNTETPQMIPLDQYFALYFEQYSTTAAPTGKKYENGLPISEIVLQTDYTAYPKLSSPDNNLTFYFQPQQVSQAYINQLNSKEKDTEMLMEKYISGDTEIIAVDSTGLPVSYSVSTIENIMSYQSELAQYNIDLSNYWEGMKQYRNKIINQPPSVPMPVYNLPNLGFKSTYIVNKSNLKFFQDYETAIPGACSTSLNTKIVNINDNDLEQVGTVYNIPIYRLKDTNHPLYVLAYNNKMEYYDQDPTMWDQVNAGVKKPTLEEYISNNPLLFMKDYWGRWVAVGEYDIKLPGGCGKPVIYLYPEKPTQVSVKFQVPVNFITDIPTYADFWSVLANPDGSLINLKPELTDCSKIDDQKKGSEYAKLACQKNTYPYLYWAGNVISRDYPQIAQGWIVERGKLNEFIDSKLVEIGFNTKEKSDFESYWLAEMMSKNAPYYRISFLETNELNSLFPMTVNPRPDTVFRIFLDYLPLNEKPSVLPIPQKLDKLSRNGFTMVEWGGLKRP